jgi:hypothetical protein
MIDVPVAFVKNCISWYPLRVSIFRFVTMFLGVFCLVFNPAYAISNAHDDGINGWIETDHSTWYKPKVYRIKWEKDASEERIIVPVKGLRVSHQKYPSQLLCDFVFSSRMDRFSFPNVTGSKMIRLIQDTFFISDSHARFKLYLHPFVDYDLTYLKDPDRIVIHLFSRDVNTTSYVPQYFIQSNKTYIKKDLRPMLLELGLETSERDTYRFRMQELSGVLLRPYPIDLETFYLWVGPIATSADAREIQKKFFSLYKLKIEDNELAAFKQYLSYNMRPAQESGFDVKSLREEFLGLYRAQQQHKPSWEELYQSLTDDSIIVEY